MTRDELALIESYTQEQRGKLRRAPLTRCPECKETVRDAAMSDHRLRHTLNSRAAVALLDPRSGRRIA